MCDWNLFLVLLEWSKEETDLSNSFTHIREKKKTLITYKKDVVLLRIY